MAVEQLLVRLGLDATQYNSQARQAAASTSAIGAAAVKTGVATSGMRTQMSAMAATAKFAIAGIATAAVIGFAKDSIRAAVDLGESINAVNVVFGAAAPAIRAIGETAADSFGLANSEFNQFAVQFSNFAETIAAKSGKDVASVVEDITGRIADFASVMNIDVPEAAEKFQSGLAGQVRPLRAYGIDVSATATTQKALALGLADTSSELSEQDKVLARYLLIMDQTDEMVGDFTNTQDELANATRTANANFEDFKARFGEELTPAVNEAVQSGTRLLDILDFEGVNLGWTQRLSAGIQLVTGEGAEAVKTYIEQKEALNDLKDPAIIAANVNKALADRLIALEPAVAEVAEAVVGYVTSVEALKFAEERQATASLAARDAVRAKRDALREVHNPLFEIVRLNNDLADAEEAVEEASKEGVASPEYRDAVIARARIIADLETTMVELKNQGIDPTGQAARLMFEGLGIPDNVIDEIFGQFDALEADFEGRVFSATFSLPDFNATPDGTWVRVGNTVFSQHGGIFAPRPGGTFTNIAEAGSPEAVIPLNTEGIGILAKALRQAGGSTSSSIQVSAQTNADPNQIAAAIAWTQRTMGV
jgi:hypothetical protein